MEREDQVYCSESCEWSSEEFSDTDGTEDSSCENVSCTNCNKRKFNTKSLTNPAQDHRNTTSGPPKIINDEEIENIKQQLEIYRKRAECLSKMNSELQSDLNKSIQSNLLMEQCVTCPYFVDNRGEINFPGKSDLDERFDCMLKELINIKNDLKIAQNDNYLACKMDKVLHLTLPRCSNNRPKNVNE